MNLRSCAIGVVIAGTFLAGCTSSTQYGPCIGAFDDKNPHLEYKASAWNIGMAIIFVELILPPTFVVVDETQCPVGTKP